MGPSIFTNFARAITVRDRASDFWPPGACRRGRAAIAAPAKSWLRRICTRGLAAPWSRLRSSAPRCVGAGVKWADPRGRILAWRMSSAIYSIGSFRRFTILRQCGRTTTRPPQGSGWRARARRQARLKPTDQARPDALRSSFRRFDVGPVLLALTIQSAFGFAPKVQETII